MSVARPTRQRRTTGVDLGGEANDDDRTTVSGGREPRRAARRRRRAGAGRRQRRRRDQGAGQSVLPDHAAGHRGRGEGARRDRDDPGRAEHGRRHRPGRPARRRWRCRTTAATSSTRSAPPTWCRRWCRWRRRRCRSSTSTARSTPSRPRRPASRSRPTSAPTTSPPAGSPARRCCRLVPAGSKVALIAGIVGDIGSNARIKGFKEATEGKLDPVVMVSADWDREKAFTAATDILQGASRSRRLLLRQRHHGARRPARGGRCRQEGRQGHRPRRHRRRDEVGRGRRARRDRRAVSLRRRRHGRRGLQGRHAAAQRCRPRSTRRSSSSTRPTSRLR